MSNTLTLHRFEPRRSYEKDVGTDELRLGVFLDVETTGLDREKDKITQLAMLPFAFTSDGRVFEIGFPLLMLEDPGIPITAEITALTGITDNMVRGQKIDDALVELMMQHVVLVVAHNAEFDREAVERRWPGLFENVRWACSFRDVPWREEGFRHATMEWLLYKLCLMFTDEQHRADVDCAIGVHILAQTLPSGRRVLDVLLEAARAHYVRVWAENAPYETRELTKARGYRWNGSGEHVGPRAWFRDVKFAEVKDELAWLRENIPCVRPTCAQFSGKERFSRRAGAAA